MTEDTHLYLDLSGSMDVEHDLLPVVQREVTALQRRSEQTGQPIELWLTSFTHVLADDTRKITVTPEYPTTDELKTLLAAMSNYHGGTDFRVVWAHINALRQRARRRNVIISDLEWACDVDEIVRLHPRRLDYACTPIRWGDDRFRIAWTQRLVEANLPHEHLVH